MNKNDTDETLKKICPRCGKRAAGARKAGSLTAYLFGGADCRCSPGLPGERAEAPAGTADHEIEFCDRCGLQIVPQSREGSLTGFLFQSTRCKCEPDPDFAAGAMSDRFWRLKQAGGDTIFTRAAESESGEHVSIGLAAGAIIGGEYEIIELLGRGGMGEVYLARHTRLGRKCALKVIPPEQVTEEGWRRFQQEAKSVANLDHINLVKVTDLGIHDGCLPYYAMDYVEGRNLAELVEERGRVPLNMVLDIFKQVCDGLECAHRKGILHRDLKPANIIVSTASALPAQARILDFGLAKLTNRDRDQQSLTAFGDIFGSPFYMSPEQCQGDKLDNRSDLYSLGCTMFECLTGQPPYTGNLVAAVMFGHMEGEAPSLETIVGPGKLPLSIEIVLAKLLRKNPVERYQTCGELRGDLERVARGEDIAPVYLSRGGRVSAAAASNMRDKGLGQSSGDIYARERDEASQPRPVTGWLTAFVAVFLIAGGASVYGVVKLVSKPVSAPKTVSVFMRHEVDYRDVRQSEEKALTDAKKTLDRSGPISNGVTVDSGVQIRVFRFPPDIEMGFLSNLRTGVQQAARGTVRELAADPLVWILRGPVTDLVHRYPEVLSKVGPDDLWGVDFSPRLDPAMDIQEEKESGEISPEMVRQFKDWKALHTLNLEACVLPNASLLILDEATAPINSLSLVRAEVDAEAFAKTKLLGKLVTFDGTDLKNIDSILYRVSGSPNLKKISIAVTKPTKGGLAALARCPNLANLDVSNCQLDQAKMAAISSMKNLTTLRLQVGSLSLEELRVLKNLKKLRYLEINFVKGGQEELAELKRLLPGCTIIIGARINRRGAIFHVRPL